MANSHAERFREIRGCKLVGACDLIKKRAEGFATRHGISHTKVFTDVDAMLTTVDIDAVAIVTTDAYHAPISLKCIATGKHVLCEKPLAVNYPDARRMVAAAKRRGLINMVNLSYRSSPALQRAQKLVADGAIGNVMHVEASYLQGWLASRYWGDWKSEEQWMWKLSSKHGSKGVLGDIGVHILDFATFPVGDIKTVNCRLKTFNKAPGNRIGEYKFDANDSAIITVELAGGGIGTISTTRWATGYKNALELKILGDKGGIRIDLDKSCSLLEICRGRDVDKAKWKTITCGRTPDVYQRFITSIRTGKNDQPDFARGAKIQKIMDACFISDKTGRTVKV